MKGKITAGSGLRGLFRYIQKADAEHISGSCEPRDFLRTCAALRALRPDVRQAAVHISLSHDPDDPRKMNEDDWRRAWEIARAEMEMEEMEFQIVRHHDTAHDHAHGVFCKIKPDGTLWNDSHSARRLHRACEQIERELGLRATATVEEHRALRTTGSAAKPISDGALRQFQRTGEVPRKTKSALEKQIAKRKKDERKNASADAHRGTGRRDGILEESRAGNPRRDPFPKTPNRSAGSRAKQGSEANRSAGVQTDRPAQPDRVEAEECWLEGRRFDAPPAFPPALGGRIENRAAPVPGAFDLFWSGREKPTFRWHADSGQIQLLARPDEKNIRALFDLARDSGMRPPLRLFGTLEFQRAACAEARAQGIEVRPENDRIAREHERELRRIAEERAAAAARAAAEHEAEQMRRAAAACAEEDRRAAQHRRHPTPTPTPGGEPK